MRAVRLASRELVSVEQVQSSSCMLLSGCAITYITAISAGMSIGAGGEPLARTVRGYELH